MHNIINKRFEELGSDYRIPEEKHYSLYPQFGRTLFQYLWNDEVKVVPKKWGFELHILNNEFYCLKCLVMFKGARLGNHSHFVKNETFVILYGECEATFDFNTPSEKLFSLKKNNNLFVPVGTKHTILAKSDTIILEVSTHDDANDNARYEPYSHEPIVT